MNFGDNFTKLKYMAKGGLMGMKQTNDDEYEAKKKRFNNYESELKELQKHVQNLSKHFSGKTKLHFF